MKTKIFSVLAACAFCVAASAYPTRVRLIGEATATGWSLDDAAIMVESADGVYEWVGDLKEGSLKFLTGTDWVPSLGPTVNNSDLQLGETDLQLRQSYDDDDNAFSVQQGRYSLKIDLTQSTPKLTVAAGTDLEDRKAVATYPQVIYPIGDATEAGWSLDDAMEVPETAFNSGEYKMNISLKNGELKFLSKRDFTSAAWGATKANEVVSEGSSYDCMPIDDNDYKFIVNFDATIDLTLNLQTSKLTIAKQIETMLENIEFKSTDKVNVYNINGCLIHSDIVLSDIAQCGLQHGIYIIRNKNKSEKIVL